MNMKKSNIKKEIKEDFPEQSKEQKKAQDKELKRILMFLGISFVVVIAIFFLVNASRHFEYKDIKFNVIKEGKITFYNTEFPIYSSITGNHVADYNIYLRKDPRKLEKIPFDGKVNLDVPIKKMVLESNYDEKCEGDFNIAVANLMKSFSLIGIEVVKDENATCDSQGRYMFVEIEPGDKTKIEQIGSCYKLIVNNCEILDVTEKFIVEAFSEFDSKIYTSQ